MENEGEAAKFVRKMNTVMVQTNNFVPRTCEYYLHFNVKLQYPEIECKKDNFQKKKMSSFHGCIRKNKDGSNRIIEKRKWCLWPTTSPFWKKAVDVPFKSAHVLKKTKKN